MSTRETAVEDSAAARSLAVDETALRLVDLALAEDLGAGDWTTRWSVRAAAVAELAGTGVDAILLRSLPVAAPPLPVALSCSTR